MTKPTTEELKDLLAKVTQGDWQLDDDGWIVGNEPVCMIEKGGITGVFKEAEHDATIIALAPTLAAEVVRLREALIEVADQVRVVSSIMAISDDKEVFSMLDRNVHAIARQALSQE